MSYVKMGKVASTIFLRIHCSKALLLTAITFFKLIFQSGNMSEQKMFDLKMF